MCDSPAALEGELLELGTTDAACRIEQWHSGGWYRWRCTAPDHHASGENRDQAGRERALRQHADYVTRERAAGTMTAYVPVEVDGLRGQPSARTAAWALTPKPPVDVDMFTDAPRVRRVGLPPRVVLYVDRPADAVPDSVWWSGVTTPGAVLELIGAASIGGDPGRPFVVTEVDPVDGGARIRIVAESS